MSMHDLNEALALLESMKDVEYHGAKPESLILRAEEVLGIRFPPTYRKFLIHHGGAAIRGYEFYGLLHDDFQNSGIPDAVWVTLRHRTTENLPPSLILIQPTGDGGYYAIDVSRVNPDGDSPIIVWWCGSGQPLERCEVVANDFGAFLLEEVRWAIDDSNAN